MCSWSADARRRPAKSSDDFVRLIHHGRAVDSKHMFNTCTKYYNLNFKSIMHVLLCDSVRFCWKSAKKWWFSLILMKSEISDVGHCDVKILLAALIWLSRNRLEWIPMKCCEVTGKTRQKSQNGWIVHVARRWRAFRSPRDWEFFAFKVFLKINWLIGIHRNKR